MNTSSDIIKKQSKFGFTVRNKSFENKKIKQAIDQYLLGFGVELPDDKATFEKMRSTIFDYDAYGDALESKLIEIVKFRYAIQNTKGYYAMFEHKGQNVLQPLAFWYSKHRLCALWNWRKSQIIRKRYKDFLEEARDTSGNKLINHYQPIHMVLTVPHQGGLFRSKRFYVKELIEAFRDMRKNPLFSQYIYAGEYGVEVKKSKAHGLHIHIHSFLLQYPEYTVEQTREVIETLWRNQVDNYTDYSGIHYETLYTIEKNDLGKSEKNYISPKNSSIDHYLSGVMECIKYHFKPDCLEKIDGGYDIELIEDILNNTKGKRLYSRFGKFYNVTELNFNNIEKEEDDIVLEENELTEQPELNTTVEGVQERVVNPFTEKLASRTEYKICISNPLSLKYREKDSKRALQAYVLTKKVLLIAPDELTLKQVIRLDLMGLSISEMSFRMMVDTKWQEGLKKATNKNTIAKKAKQQLEEIEQFPEVYNFKDLPIDSSFNEVPF